MFRRPLGTYRRRPVLTDADDAPVTVYGTGWCGATQMVRRYLDRLGIPYVYRDMEDDPAATAQVKWWTGGYASHPTVQIGGRILVEPGLDELRKTLAQEGLV